MELSSWVNEICSIRYMVETKIAAHFYVQENADMIDRDDEQKFLASADFLSNYGLPALMLDMQAAATEILKGQILERFMSIGSPHHWVSYIMPEDARFDRLATASSSDSKILSDVTKFDQLMVETGAVLTSAEFGSVVDISLKAVLDALVEDMGAQSGGSLTSGMPLAKLLSLVTQMGPLLLYEPSKNRFIQIIQSDPEVEIFFTLLYANMPPS
ncbi:peroxisome biogenesis protein 3-2 [Quercus suber]|uniref:Peroxisome biogenesis protein 3-2 n=1 Tax=Quercus suber TaxID=58331 RepID=A0AAW0L215_QUESU